MGKTFIDCALNGFNLKTEYEQIIKSILKENSASEGSKEDYLNGLLPDFKEVINIELGCDGTQETIIRFNGGNFMVVEGYFRQ